MNHDVVTIGASAGAVELLLDLAADLPAKLDASLFIVIHLPAGHLSSLPELLSNRGPLPARHPLHNEAIERGTIYIAPPDNQLQLNGGVMEVVRGPRENGFRPAADVLFRSASASYGSRVIGVVLSGYQDCGTAGMMSIKARGGLGVVQDPATATAPEMPQHVLDAVKVDHVVHPLELPGLLTKLVGTPAGPTLEPDRIIRELEGAEPGTQTVPIVCPSCQGVLTETNPGVFEHFRCHVGHSFNLDTLVREQSEELERVMWAAVRALEESAALSRRISHSEANAELRRRFAEKAETQTRQAGYLKQLLLHSSRLGAEDADRIL